MRISSADSFTNASVVRTADDVVIIADWDADHAVMTPPELPHRPWLVPGVGALKQFPIKEHSVANVLGDRKPGNGTLPSEPFYLIVTDKDNGTFSVEGPMTDDRQWNHAVVVAQKSGRQVTCSTANGSSAEDAARDWLQRYSGKQVPPGEIVHL